MSLNIALLFKRSGLCSGLFYVYRKAIDIMHRGDYTMIVAQSNQHGAILEQ